MQRPVSHAGYIRLKHRKKKKKEEEEEEEEKHKLLLGTSLVVPNM